MARYFTAMIRIHAAAEKIISSTAMVAPTPNKNGARDISIPFGEYDSTLARQGTCRRSLAIGFDPIRAHQVITSSRSSRHIEANVRSCHQGGGETFMADPLERFLAWVGGAPKKSIASAGDSLIKDLAATTSADASFSKMPDGRVVFYPYGRLFAKGYVIPTERGYQTLRARITLWMALSAALTYGAIGWRGYPLGFAVLAGCVVFYWAWMRFAVRGLQRSSFGGPIRPRQ